MRVQNLLRLIGLRFVLFESCFDSKGSISRMFFTIGTKLTTFDPIFCDLRTEIFVLFEAEPEDKSSFIEKNDGGAGKAN